MLTRLRKALGLYNYQPLNLIEVSRQNLVNNFNFLSHINRRIKVAPVLKSNAYGHGLEQISKIFTTQDAPAGAFPFVCVDSLFEAYQLKKFGVKKDILIMGAVDPRNIRFNRYDFIYALFDLDLVKALNEYKPNSRVHLFVDTGMNREGIKVNDLPVFLQELKKLKNIKVEGLMSHLAQADNPKCLLTQKQLNNFKNAQKIVNQAGFHPKWIHILNSDGLLNRISTPGVEIQNLARTGLALYGISQNPHLKPVLTFKTKIIQIKKLLKGERVGYDTTFKASKNMVIGILPVGYNDGVDRRLSNKGLVLVDNTICPIIGLISMNITTIDLSKVKNPYIGQEVIIYSDNPADPNSIQNTAKLCKTIPYELLIHLHPTTKRVVI